MQRRLCWPAAAHTSTHTYKHERIRSVWWKQSIWQQEGSSAEDTASCFVFNKTNTLIWWEWMIQATIKEYGVHLFCRTAHPAGICLPSLCIEPSTQIQRYSRLTQQGVDLSLEDISDARTNIGMQCIPVWLCTCWNITSVFCNTMILCFCFDMHKTIVELILMWLFLTLGADVAINMSFMFEGEFYYHTLTVSPYIYEWFGMF